MVRPNARLRLLIRQLSSLFDQMGAALEQTGTSADRYNTIRQRLLAGKHELHTIDQQVDHETAERKRIEEALEASNEELRNFIYMTSHDLREPLRKISSFGAILKESIDGTIEQEDRENLEFMIDGAERMTHMIEDLLAYSRIHTKTIVAETVDLNGIVQQLETLDLGALLEDSGATIETPQPLPNVQADHGLVKQLLRNLIINAIKHRKEDIAPRIVIRAERIAEDEIRIELEDNGAGIEAKNDKDIFKMSLHSREEYEDAGTGLAVCKKIVDRHGGRMGVESKAGDGSTLWFTLPGSKPWAPEQGISLS